MGRWGQKPVTPQKGEQVETYVLEPTALEELYAKYGKPGEIAPGVKAERGRDNHRRQQAAAAEEASTPRGESDTDHGDPDESHGESEEHESETEHEDEDE